MSNEIVHVASYHRSLNKYTEELCGDKVEVRMNADSFIMVLADGLGSGVKANILSTLTSTIISEMMCEGASVEDVVETITATLPECQERHVAYATFTILQVDYDGQAKLVEFDNPPAIVLRNNQSLDLERHSIQIGNRTIKISDFKVEEDDFIVFYSDGIIHAGLGSVLNLGWTQEEVVNHLLQVVRSSDTPREVNTLLLTTVDDLYGNKPGDDSTVAVAKILKAKETCVMVGPPIEAIDDERVVEKLLAATGLKICCGGTTSNIVARITNQEIEMDLLESLVSDVPPTGRIKGIDLVTEGVLTLGKVNEMLEECVGSDQILEQLQSSKSKDGATLLTQALVSNSSKITFMVGCSDNPAHKAIAYSTISVSAKIRLIEKISDNLRRLGKIVQIEHY